MMTLPSIAADSRGRLAGPCRPLVAAAVALIAATAVIRPAALPQEPATPRPPEAAKRGTAAEKAAEKEAVAVPALAGAGDDRAQRAELTAAAKSLFRQMFLTELRFIRFASGATDDQARRMAREAARPFRTMVTEFVARELKAKQDKQPAGEHDANAFAQSVRKDLAEIARAQLTPEQWARYRAQAESRDEYRKQVAIRNLLAKLDGELALTAEQRDRLAGSLTAHWTGRWETDAIYLDVRTFPEIPDPVIVPFLTERQRTTWKGLAKGSEPAEIAGEILLMIAAGDAARDDFDLEETTSAGPAPKR